MKMKIIFLLFFLPCSLFSQTWQWARQIGGNGIDEALIGGIDLEGKVYIYGKYAAPFNSTNYSNCYFSNDTILGSDDAFVAKYDALGNAIWIRSCISASGKVRIWFAYDKMNNVSYISGTYDISCTIDTCHLLSNGYNTAFLAKFDTDGNCIWAKTISGPSAATIYSGAMTIDMDGNIYLSGTTNFQITIGTNTLNPGTYIAKFDASGNNLWAETKLEWTGFQTQISFNTLRCLNDNIYIAGEVYIPTINDTLRIDTSFVSNVHGNGVGLLCFDRNTGTCKWLKVEGTPHVNPYLPMMDIDVDGNIYCTGRFYDTCTFSQTTLISSMLGGIGVNGYLSKYDSLGNFIWIKQFTATNTIGNSGIFCQSDGSVLTAGTFSGQGTIGSITVNSITGEDLFIARFNSNGDCIGVDNAGVGEGFSVASDGTDLYFTGVFPPFGYASGSISLGSQTFTSYGWEDIIFAKHDMLTAIDHIERNTNKNELVIYANPNNGSFRLKIPDDFVNEKKLTLRIFDGAGKLIREKEITLNEEHPKMDVYGEAKGIYSVTLSNQRKVYSGKMIVE